MSLLLGSLSIPRKIVAITMVISVSALLLASAALTGYDLISARRGLRASTTTLARITADNTTAAVAFNDRTTAIETLNALAAEPSIVAACIYAESALFAQYLRPGNPACPVNPGLDVKTGGYESVSTPIKVKGMEIGTLQLRASLAPVYEHLRIEILTIGGILLLSVLFAFILSARLHRLVSKPILNLAETANQISLRKDFSIRAAKESEDELGTLVVSFNEMVMQIQKAETDLMKRTGELAKANEELDRANRMKDEFLATLSHELRTPLTAIYGWVNLLEAGGMDHAKVEKAIAVIHKNVKAQMQLVDDLLNVSRIVTGKLQIRPEWTNVDMAIRSALDSIRPAAASKRIALTTEVVPAQWIFADSDRIQQVLWNLLTNAVKFTGSGGEIRVACGRVGTKLRISVTDTGEGIDPEFVPFLFERFTQADSSRTRKHGGLGLGLAIVRHIVELHGGQVMVHSQGKGFGSTFVVELPVPAIRPVPESRPAAGPMSLRGTQVMVVEDEPDAREIIAEGLEQYGASVILAASAAEALGLLARQKPDVLVSDIGMSDMDGYELLKKIRLEYADIQHLPALALTAYASEEDKIKSFEAGYQAHLPKPVEMTELVNAVAALADPHYG